MTKIHCTLEETVKRKGLQTLGHWLDHHGAEEMPGPFHVFCGALQSGQRLSLLGTWVLLQMAVLLQSSGKAKTVSSLLSRDPA